MKLIYAALLLCLSTLICSGQPSSGVNPPCYTDQIWAEMVRQDPSLQVKRQQMDMAIAKHTANINPQAANPNRSVVTSLTVIPTVIYVVYDSAAINISMAQIQSQMDQLNQNFQASGFAFCYAKKDITTQTAFAHQTGDSAGVFRIHNNSLSNVGPSNDAQLKALSNLPSQNYLRIFIVHTISPQGVLGYALLPGSSTALDGIVIRSDVFGSNTYCPTCQLYPSYNLGASLTHECGHYLNLYHTFQGGCDTGTYFLACQYKGDWVCDTPPTTGTFGCPSPAPLSCDGVHSELIQNYMDYSNDPCKNSFTPGQKVRMQAGVNGYRNVLISTANLINTGITCIQIGNQYASFFSTNFDGCVGKSMTFASLNSSGFTYTWDFGDGTTATGDTVSHTFAAVGTYQVTLNANSTALNVNANNTVPVFITACHPILCGVNRWEANVSYLDFSSGTPIATNHAILDSFGFGNWPNYYGYYYRADSVGNPLFHFYSSAYAGHDRALRDTSLRIVDSLALSQNLSILPVRSTPGKFCIIGSMSYADSLSSGPVDSMVYSFVQASHGSVTVLPGKKNKIIPMPSSGWFYGISNNVIAAIPNCDGTKFWVVVFVQNSTFKVFEESNDTVFLHQTYTVQGLGNCWGLVASADGRNLACGTGYINGVTGICTLKFNKGTGNIISDRFISEGIPAYHPYNYSEQGRLCFSPNGRFLYTEDLCCANQYANTGYVYQLDLYNANPWAAKMPIYQFERDDASGESPNQMIHHGPDDKVYIGHNAQPGNDPVNFRLGVINYPNVLENGLNSCGYNNNGPYVLPPQNNYSMYYGGFDYIPDNPDAYGCNWHPEVPTPFTYSPNNCMSYAFYSDECFTVAWDFNDPSSGSSNTSTIAAPTHVFSHNGTYAVHLVTGGHTYTDTITIGAPATTIAATTIDPCPVPHANYSVGNIRPGVTYLWTITHGTPATSQGINVDVQWNTSDTTGTVSVVAIDPVLGCTDTAVLHISYHASNSFIINNISANLCAGSVYHLGSQNLTQTGVYNDTVTSTSGCKTVTHLTLTVVPLPTVTWPGGVVTYHQHTNLPLTGGTPAGGVYSGGGVYNGTFYPDSVASGTHTLTYTYTDGNGCSASATRSYVISGISDIGIEAQILLYPNPANNRLVAESDLFSSAEVQVALYDMTARLIVAPVDRTSDKAIFDISGLSNGVYSVRFVVNGQEASKRFIKME